MRSSAARSIVLVPERSADPLEHVDYRLAETPEEKGLAIAKEAQKRNEGWVDSKAEMKMILACPSAMPLTS